MKPFAPRSPRLASRQDFRIEGMLSQRATETGLPFQGHLVIARLVPVNQPGYMKNNPSNTRAKIFKSICLFNVYPRLTMALCLVLCMLGLGLSANAGGTRTTTTTTFDAPGAGTGARQGTTAFGINPGGTITGFFRDTNNARHGFVRTS